MEGKEQLMKKIHTLQFIGWISTGLGAILILGIFLWLMLIPPTESLK